MSTPVGGTRPSFVRAGGGQVSARKWLLRGPTSLAPLCLKHLESRLAHLLVINNYLLMDKHCLLMGTGAGMNYNHYFLSQSQFHACFLKLEYSCFTPLVSAVQTRGSAICKHISPPSRSSLPLTPSQPSRSSQSTGSLPLLASSQAPGWTSASVKSGPSPHIT